MISKSRLKRNDVGQLSMPLFVPEFYEEYTKAGYFYVIKKSFRLNWVQRFFLLLEIPDSSYLSEFFSFLVLFATLLSVITYVLGTIPELRHTPDTCELPVCHNTDLCPGKMICEPLPPESFQVIEKVCLILFFVDYVCRVCTVGTVPSSLAGVISKTVSFDDESFGLDNFDDVDPVYTWYHQTILYIHQPVNIIDIVAILPLFFELGNVHGESLTFIRVLRLARILRILKLGKRSEGVQLLLNTVISSLSALTILAFFLTIGVIFISAILFYFESGTFQVTPTYQGGAYITETVYGEDVKTVFISIPATIYYTVVTTCTVGYGDMYPQTAGGQFIAIVAMYFGVIVLAFPISVIGNRFDKYYDKARGSMSELIAQCVINLIKPWDKHPSMYTKPNGKRQLAYETSKKLSSLFVLSKVILDTANQKKIEELLHEKGLSECIDYAEHMIKFHSKNIKTISTHNINDSNRISYKIVHKRKVENKLSDSLIQVVEENTGEKNHHKIDVGTADSVPPQTVVGPNDVDVNKKFIDFPKDISIEKLQEIEELANAILKYTKIMKNQSMVANATEKSESMKQLFEENVDDDSVYELFDENDEKAALSELSEQSDA